MSVALNWKRKREESDNDEEEERLLAYWCLDFVGEKDRVKKVVDAVKCEGKRVLFVAEIAGEQAEDAKVGKTSQEKKYKLIDRRDANKKWPQAVIRFYEGRLV